MKPLSLYVIFIYRDVENGASALDNEDNEEDPDSQEGKH